jgi:hypothetical protein
MREKFPTGSAQSPTASSKPTRPMARLTRYATNAPPAIQAPSSHLQFGAPSTPCFHRFEYRNSGRFRQRLSQQRTGTGNRLPLRLSLHKRDTSEVRLSFIVPARVGRAPLILSAAHEQPALVGSKLHFFSATKAPWTYRAPLVLMLVSEVSVRCTGHFLAISSSFERCSLLNGPANSISSSIRSTLPSLVSHSAQSVA